MLPENAYTLRLRVFVISLFQVFSVKCRYDIIIHCGGLSIYKFSISNQLRDIL